MFFVLSLHLSDRKVFHNIASSSSFFDFAHILYFKFLEFEEFNKTIIPFALVGYETGYSQRRAMHLVGYLPSHIQRTLMEHALISQKTTVYQSINHRKSVVYCFSPH